MIKQDSTQLSAGLWPDKTPIAGRLSQTLKIAVFLALVVGRIQAKDLPANAIVLFDGSNGPAYVQMTGVTVNGKTELRVCDVTSKLEKRTYDLLLRVQITGAASLERGADGVLMLATPTGTFCVVPSNLKFDKNADLTPAQAADQAVLQGLIVDPPQVSEVPALKPGVRLVFVPAPDADLAQFLLARRANSAKVWQEYITHYPSSPHTGDARKALAALYESAAESAFTDYQKSSAAHTPDLSRLKAAQQQADQASKALEGYTPAHKLDDKIAKEIDALLDSDRARLQAYRKSLADHTAGYQDLSIASQNIAQVIDVNPRYGPALGLQSEIAAEQHKLDSAIDTGEAMVAAQRYEDALNAINPYSAFAPEVPRLDAIRKAVYTYHFNRARTLSDQQSW